MFFRTQTVGLGLGILTARHESLNTCVMNTIVEIIKMHADDENKLWSHLLLEFNLTYMKNTVFISERGFINNPWRPTARGLLSGEG